MSGLDGQSGGALRAYASPVDALRTPENSHMLRNYRIRQDMTRSWAAHDAYTYRCFRHTVEEETGRPLDELRILDLGCGSNAPMTLILRASGCHVIGIDTHLGFRWGLGFRPERYREYHRQAGLARTIRKIAGELVYDRTYYRHLGKLTGLHLSEEGLNLQQMDIQHPALPDAAFDVIHSNATWEHLADIDAANRTLARCLAPGGIAYIEIHLFPSLSGGHDLPWIVPGSIVMGEVRPWQHLRSKSWRAPVFLNRLRECDYRQSFENTAGLRIERWQSEFTEGHELLTPEILEELPEFAAEELTKRSIIVVARREEDRVGTTTRRH